MKKEVKLALCGEARVGKDTVADYLEYGYHMVPFAFGDELKKDFHYKYPHIPRIPKPVSGYQLFGQLEREIHGADYWINRCFENIQYVARIARNYNWVNLSGEQTKFCPVITDLRQPNELARLREEGYIIIRVEAPLDVRMDRMEAEGDKVSERNLNFETETFVKDFDVDYTIVNDSTLEYLQMRVDDIMSYILEDGE